VKELLDEFLDFSAARGRAPSTLRNYRRISDHFFLPTLGEIPIDSLTPFRARAGGTSSFVPRCD